MATPWNILCVGVGRLAYLVKFTGSMTLVKRYTNHVTAMTFSCATMQCHVMYKLQRNQRSVPVIPCLYGVGG